MPEISLIELYKNMQKEMMANLSLGGNAFVHPGTKGDETETNWVAWFRKYLPKRYAIDKGIVIDSTGKQSDQIDIILYDTQYSYLVFNHNDIKLIPAESVYAVFEVKPTLNKAHMEYAENKAKSVRLLYRTSSPIKHAGGEYPPKPLHEIVAGLLTTSSEWAVPTVNNVVKNNSEDRFMRLDIISSMSNETIVVDNNTFVDDYKSDIHYDITFSNDEESLIFLLLKLLIKLQNIGTVPAIDFSKYMNVLTCNYYKKTRR